MEAGPSRNNLFPNKKMALVVFFPILTCYLILRYYNVLLFFLIAFPVFSNITLLLFFSLTTRKKLIGREAYWRSLYANPQQPDLCVHLAFAVFIFSKSADSHPTLFFGGSQSDGKVIKPEKRFGEALHAILVNNKMNY